MNYNDLNLNSEKLENHLYCAGTVYDSFEALLEVLGKLQLEQPLYLVYLAQKLFAQEVLNLADQKESTAKFPFKPIEIKKEKFYHQAN